MGLVNHISAFTNIIGSEHPDIAYAFASANWENDGERNQFINELLELNDNQKIGD